MHEVQLKSFAKINIGLKVVAQRPDGYHEIETIFQLIDLSDRIKISLLPQNEIIIRCSDPRVPIGEQNICYRAAQRLQQALQINRGVQIDIEKQIPVGSGLGGGSSNAAAVLGGLARLLQVRLPERQLHSIAAELGADVPYFLSGGTAYGTGRGDVLQAISLPFRFQVVLIIPNIEVSSRWAYRNFNFSLTKIKKSIKLSHLFLNCAGIDFLKHVICNDLEEVVFQQHSLLRCFKEWLYERGAFLAAMSGSGSAIYGLFENHEAANEVVTTFPWPFRVVLAQPMITKSC
ncbi:MAG: 4-(cytidine 5'-diphospho)-2-C-methyl-D-erythritol kinase [candidate division KSB1 bacterium]|nr:4-(cytidine 5'-diphospho)-2-C-methyl-D-erythritol kinase [candidate division KSB1 bacterium]MDZ7318372.1 4-(cytidine 5'-diphospho)-2-C-methyl-D-erythritol kinase [candidate division KSB1 bacterium]MDZ7341015.1 4-(cytidine 5'-diphospho)-2-C-methyl-D-erythritol kinase [candidate division KSB1 bacterium]